MPFGSKRADLLERSLGGYKSTDMEVCELVATAGRIPALTSLASAPRPEFVSALGIRIRAEAMTLPAREARPIARNAQGQDIAARRSAARPKVLVIGRGLPRVLAGTTASLLLVGAVIGGASRSALPGGLFYPVKALLDSAAVQLAGSDFDRGTTLLSQAQEHISDAGALVERDGAQVDPAFVNQALLSGFDAVTAGQRALLGEFDQTGNPQALIAVQDFDVRALPQLKALRPLVPESSRPQVDALITLLQETETTLARRIAVCGQPCAALVTSVSSVTASPSAASTGLASTVTTSGVATSRSTGAITSLVGVLVDPFVAPPLIATSGTTARVLPPVTVGPITVSPSPIVIPPLPLPTSAPTVLPLPLPNGLPGLP